MARTSYAGINYAGMFSNINRDEKTGIRYGVIPANDLPCWYDEAESDYGEATCPNCDKVASGASDVTDEQEENLEPASKFYNPCFDYACLDCNIYFDSESAYPETPNVYRIDNGNYKAMQGGEGSDVFILKSPYFTYAQFCSPCTPGACYLLSPLTKPREDNKAYCPSPDSLQDEKPPFPVYLVETGECIYMPENWSEHEEE